jgi:hypothetical protein
VTALPRLGSCTLPPLNAELDGLWHAILDLAEDLSAELGIEPLEANERWLLHRFVRPSDKPVVGVLAPDHAPPGWKPTTIPPRTRGSSRSRYRPRSDH